MHVAESTPEEKDKYRSQFLTVLHWVTFVSGIVKWVNKENGSPLIFMILTTLGTTGPGGCISLLASL